ncbi:MAG: alpha/beta hydrolase [Clostridia bacterium]|nr:alpha/beta hydrolase [Clostridia bacterium]
MWWLFPLIAGVLVAAVAFGCYLAAFYVSPAVRRRDVLEETKTAPAGSLRASIHTLVGELRPLPYEEVTITARDGCPLHARYYHAAEGAPLQIMFHGWRSTAEHDFGGGHKMARALGHNILLVDQRAHGKSGGHALSFGIRERYDCADWAFFAARQYPTSPLLLTGISMGAATVLMASSLPLPDNVVGIMADCPYSSPAAIIRKVCGDAHVPGWLAMPFLHLGAWLFGGFRLADGGAVEAVKEAKLPILLVHGEADDFVPCAMSREIAAACASPLTFLTVPGAGHGASFLVDNEGYKAAMTTFLRQVLPEEKRP